MVAKRSAPTLVNPGAPLPHGCFAEEQAGGCARAGLDRPIRRLCAFLGSRACRRAMVMFDAVWFFTPSARPNIAACSLQRHRNRLPCAKCSAPALRTRRSCTLSPIATSSTVVTAYSIAKFTNRSGLAGRPAFRRAIVAHEHASHRHMGRPKSACVASNFVRQIDKALLSRVAASGAASRAPMPRLPAKVTPGWFPRLLHRNLHRRVAVRHRHGGFLNHVPDFRAASGGFRMQRCDRCRPCGKPVPRTIR